MHKQQRILFLSLYTFGLTGGIEKVCRSLTSALHELKNMDAVSQYHCLSMYDENPDPRYIDAGHFTGFNGNRIAFGQKTIREGLKSDIILLSHINLLVFGWLIKKLKPKARIILLAHGIEIWEPLKNWKKRFLQQKTEIWAVSKYTANRVQQQHSIAPHQINILNNCLDPFFDVPQNFEKPTELLERYGLNADQKILYTLTRLSSREQYKGYDQVLAVLKHLPEEIHYVLGGKADALEQKRIQQLINQYGLQHRVTLTGFIADSEITPHFLLADIFVMPSKAEGFGISFIEAAACGCKVIAGNGDGSKDALLNGELGFLIDPTNQKELLKAILEALALPIVRDLQQQKTLNHFAFSNYLHKTQQLLSIS
ncbi:glycosyltransferase family 4 protein [Pedobacter soli]|uniref:Glycosyltransferase involved in cell wall bisynthesis n=1 Tax=Pedobacter soli TaxID=390242 RepID=A0A1G6X4I2_9SPHI|nr:glycosyltransferase family 4 protein [Pedobacter soli]SDD73052.1 Glycosyltransferase involved in cell wall bisynthesis [Pedobacter soli]